jgi:protein-disulfide isomerase
MRSSHYLLGLVLLFLSGQSLAQTPIEGTNNTSSLSYENMYLELPDNLIVEADNEHKVIRYFFDFSCVYCAHLRDVMKIWGGTLSNDYYLVYHHVGVSDSQDYFIKAAAMTYVMNSDIPQSKKDTFIEHMFSHTPKVQTTSQLVRLVKEAAADVGIEFEPLGRYIMSKEALEDYADAIELQNSVHVQVTPSLLVGGKYLTNLSLTDGQPASWIQLINKVTSIDYYTRQNKLSVTGLAPLQVSPKKD